MDCAVRIWLKQARSSDRFSFKAYYYSDSYGQEVVNCLQEEKQMTTEEQRASEEELLEQAAEELAQVHARIGPRFRRAEARERARGFLQGLLAPVERKNGWQMAEELGERGPRGVQRLLGEADWDEEAVRDDLQAYVVEHLGEDSGILVVDETGFVKKGKKSAGVARQYSGTAGRRENSQVGVFLLYASTKGAAFLDRALYLPEEWMGDRVRCREAGIPDEVSFATKGELARQMLLRAFAAGVPAEWVAGDTVYGYDELRMWLDEQQKSYVVAVPETHAGVGARISATGRAARRIVASRRLGGALSGRRKQRSAAL